MKKFLIPVFGLFVLASASVNAEPEKEADKTPAASEEAPAASGEAKEADKTTASEEEVEVKEADKTPPSEDTKKVAKKAKEGIHAFDPQTYTCKQFVEDFNKDKATDELGIAAIWGHGYFSSAYGTDEMGPLTEESVAEVIQYFLEYCEKDKSATLSRAAYNIAEEEE